MLRILHTSDWHLGQKLHGFDRSSEQKQVLDWLLATIDDVAADGLLVSGDLFDATTPPHEAQYILNNFLVELKKTACRHVVLTGGNHDSPSLLNISNPLYAFLDIRIVPSAPENIEDLIVPWYQDDGQLIGVIAAVPFLRERDLDISYGTESQTERHGRLQRALRDYYAQLVPLMTNDKVPNIGMGHLFASGSKDSDHQHHIYLGDQQNMTVADFPNLFDYVALGHIHRAQPIGGERTIRYSGSLIPLAFDECNYKKSVTVVDFEASKATDIQLIDVPQVTEMVSFTGDKATIEKNIKAMLDLDKPTYIQALVTDSYTPTWQAHINSMVAQSSIKVLRLTRPRQSFDSAAMATNQNLNDWSPEDIFAARLDQEELSDDARKELISTYQELMHLNRQSPNA